MTYFRKIVAGLGVVLLAAGLLLWFFPAQWAVALMAPRLGGMQLQGVSGLVWQGHAAQLRDPQRQNLGSVQWRLSRRALLGDLRLQLKIQGPQLFFSGTVKRLSAQQFDWRNVRARLIDGAPGASSLVALGRPRGELALTVDHALLQNGWPLALEATAQWHDGSIQGPDGEVKLGNWRLQAQARDGWIKAQFQSEDHSPLRGHGQIQGNLLGWRLDATLQPGKPDRPLSQWLHRWGTFAADGSVHIARHGGLAL